MKGVLWIGLLAPMVVMGQVNTATIAGTVTDQSNAAVPGATVVARNLATNLATRSVTGGEGIFVLPNLAIGRYAVVVEKSGFRTATQSGILLAVDQRARVDFQLRLGDVAESISVQGDGKQVDTESSTVGQVIDNKRVVELPLNGRNFVQLTALSPGTLVQGNSQFTGEPNVLVNGNRGGATGFLFDGAENFEQNAQTVQISPSIETIQEFKVQTSNFGADSGRQAAVVSVISKSGTNEFHGNLFEFLRNRVFDARNFFSVDSRSEDRKRNQFGGTFGGPIKRNRMFFFGGYEGNRQRIGAVRNSLVPTAAQREGNLAGLPAIFDPATTVRATSSRDPFPGNVIPRNRLASQALGILEYIPGPNAAGDRFNTTTVGKLTNDQMNLKVDHRVTDRDNYFARFTRDSRDETSPGPFPIPGGDVQKVLNYNAVASYTRTFSPTMINEFRVSYSRFDLNFDTTSKGLAVIDKLGITGLDGRKKDGIEGFPILNVTGYGNFGDIGIRPLEQFFTNRNFADTLTWIRGSHTLKVGFDARIYRRAAFNGINARGTYSFTGVLTQNPARPGGTGYGLADFLLGLPASAGRNFPRLRQAVNWQNYSSFVQDDWKVSRRLTLNVGLRHELNPQPTEERNRISSFDFVSGRPIAATGADGKIDQDAFIFFTQADLDYMGVVSGQSLGFPGRALRNTQYGSMAPRFGFSYDVFGKGKTVLRGGYGIFYTLVGGNLSTQSIGSVPFFRGETFAGDPLVPSLTFARAFPASNTPPLSEIFAFQREFANSYIQEWSFNVQQQAFGGTVFEVGYVANKGTKLDVSYQANQPLIPGAGGIQPRRPYPKFSTIQYNTTEGASTYHSMQAKAERRMKNGITYLASYTWSKTMSITGTNQNPYSLREAKSLADFDIPHRLVVSSVYELPFGQGRRWMTRGGVANAVLGGWSLGGILQLQAGSPFTPTTGRDIANVGTTTRPNRVGQGTVSAPNILQWFDASAFVNPANFTYGTSGVNILRGPGSQNLDAILSKSFRLGKESRWLQFRFEGFNVLNHANFGQPNGNINQPTQVGRIFGAGAPRILQLALKLNF
jgi:Carboxypeptidase regulatory-like domain